MAKQIHNGVMFGTSRFNFKVTNQEKVQYPKKIIFVPSKHVKGTPYYFPPVTVRLDEIDKLPNFKKIIDERLKENTHKTG
jgi:hypothetical protein